MMGNTKFPIGALQHPGYNKSAVSAVVSAASSIAMGGNPWLAIGSAVLGSVLKGGSKSKENRAVGQMISEQKKAEEARAKSDEIRNARERVAQVREARIRRAQVQASGTNAGLGVGTSGVIGSQSSVSSQAGNNVGYIGQVQQLAGVASAATQKAVDYSGQAMMWREVGNFGESIFNAGGGFTTIFGGNKSTPARGVPGGSQTRIS